jgi:hypothetical protein
MNDPEDAKLAIAFLTIWFAIEIIRTVIEYWTRKSWRRVGRNEANNEWIKLANSGYAIRDVKLPGLPGH